VNIEHAEDRYFVADGPLFNYRGDDLWHGRSFVILDRRVGRRAQRLKIVAACNDRKAANAARRLLSGECEAQS
jgi:hypothetical protein